MEKILLTVLIVLLPNMQLYSIELDDNNDDFSLINDNLNNIHLANEDNGNNINNINLEDEDNNNINQIIVQDELDLLGISNMCEDLDKVLKQAKEKSNLLIYSILDNFDKLHDIYKSNKIKTLEIIQKVLNFEYTKYNIINNGICKTDLSTRIKSFNLTFTDNDFTFAIKNNTAKEENKSKFKEEYLNATKEFFNNELSKTNGLLDTTNTILYNIKDLPNNGIIKVKENIFTKLQKYLKEYKNTVNNLKDKTKENYENIFKQVWKDQFENKKLYEILQVDENYLEEVLNAINMKNEEQFNKIEEFIELLSKNLSNVLQSNDSDTLNIINDILKIKEVKKYISEYWFEKTCIVPFKEQINYNVDLADYFEAFKEFFSNAYEYVLRSIEYSTALLNEKLSIENESAKKIKGILLDCYKNLTDYCVSEKFTYDNVQYKYFISKFNIKNF